MTRLPRTRPAVRRLALPLAAAALAGATLPLAAGGSAPALAAGLRAGDPGFVGYSTSATSSPLHIEIYEPTIPIPATPQAELEVGYAHVEATTSATLGRASYLWPGDAVGEGFKTIVEQLGLPAQLGQDGYPVQVNAVSPGGPAKASDEPAPGMVQRATAGPGKATASNGVSSDGDPSTGSGSGGGLPGLPGLPPIPGLPGLPGLSGVTGTLSSLPVAGPLVGGLTSGLTGGTGHGKAARAAAPGLPPELAALVDVGGMTATASTDNGDLATAKAHAGVTDVALLGGLVTVDGVSTTATASSDGTTGKPGGDATYATITALGQKFKVGPDGVEAQGQVLPIPGLPDNAAKALGELGLTITVPKPTYTRDGDIATSTRAGLIVQFDLTQLKKKLSVIPLATLIDAIPSQAGQLKSLLQAAANLSSRIVVTLAQSTASVDTSQGIDIPTSSPTTTPTATPTSSPAGPSGNGPGGTTPGGTSPSGTTPPGGTSPTTAGPTTTAPSETVATASAPLPGLFSLSTGLILLGLVLAGGIGWGARTMGVAALGAGSACTNGLETGLPDLRKV